MTARYYNRAIFSRKYLLKVIAIGLFDCKPVGLLDIEFAWSDETPYREAGTRASRIGYERVLNPLTRTEYIADYTYMRYLENFTSLLHDLPKKYKRNTFSLTREGIINGSGIKYKSLESFLDSAHSKS